MMEITSAVTDVMVEEDIYNGILIEIFEYVHVEPSSVSGQQRMTDDDTGHDTTIIPSNTQEGIINLTLVSKRFYNIISNHHDENGTKKWNIIPVLEISPPSPPQQQQSSARTFFHNMYNYTKNNEIHNKQHYHHLIVKNIHQIYCNIDDWSEVDGILRGVQLTGIMSLQFLPPYLSETNEFVTWNNNNIYHFIAGLLRLCPNIHEIDISNINEKHIGYAFSLGDVDLDHLERIRWNHIQVTSQFGLNGYQMYSSNHLKHIHMDDSVFCCFYNERMNGVEINFRDYEEESEEGDTNNNIIGNHDDIDDDEYENIFLFHECCENLESVSIRNAHYVGHEDNTTKKCITQQALIKFVKNTARTLQWFRSDLSPENIRILQTEFENIQFLN
mmetsp:Transcript_7475/g.8557  ORF Transcript_7475/g.8557 Transcript_7475/m.8557 type:complete len:387 (+) Transcript_7475:142-1302(+)